MDVRERCQIKRLIDADVLWWKLESEPWYDNADRDEIALPLVDEAPIVDAVEVVRCRECKFGVIPYGDEHDGWIECSNIHSRPLFSCNDFCSYGERKDGDGNDRVHRA